MVRFVVGIAMSLDSGADIALTRGKEKRRKANSTKAQENHSKQKQSHTKGGNKGTPNVENEGGQRKVLRSRSDP